MKPLAIFGIVLTVLGLGGLVVGRVSYTTNEKVLDIGPLHATAEKTHNIRIPDLAAVIAIVAGLVLVAASARRTS